jgi:hypothetical protein
VLLRGNASAGRLAPSSHPQGGETDGQELSNFFISLDGVVESPEQWHFPYLNDEMGACDRRGAQETTAFLMGRVLYDEVGGVLARE